jgi:hypothetical protein
LGRCHHQPEKQTRRRGLEIYQNFTEEAHLVWSKDSLRVASFEPDRPGDSTTVYFRKGSEFEEVSLPVTFPRARKSRLKTQRRQISQNR